MSAWRAMEIRRPQRLPHAGTELDVDALGLPPLEPLELLSLEAEETAADQP